ncbi:LptF/LptG family permease [uncultured Campylobacter sp.]|uniref:LptF/LptG family permease n=1 Tax=uncultured Campylobacter sp. TaxID=218934 RepID=UPI00262585BB|nr:LptF/LptG family permease [uncultured Campylobacter sp.]
MRLVYKYMLNHFLSTTLSLFSVLFLIVSMVFFIQLARVTSSIEISFLDFLKLYSFTIPRIIIFTLPISFFISLSLSLYRLSRENESIVCFALGCSPKLLANFFLKISVLVSLIMLLVSLFFIPLAYSLQNNFIDYKKTQVSLNLKTGEFGQKFLDWMIFIEKESDSLYDNIIMYHPANKDYNKEQMIVAKRGEIVRDEQTMSLNLYDGMVYDFDKNNTWRVGHFNDMSINTLLKGFSSKDQNFYQYWQDMNTSEKRAKEFVIYVLISLFPIASTYFALSFGFVTYRYEKGIIYPGIFAVISFYFGFLSVFYKPPFLSIVLIFVLFFVSGMFYFKKHTLSRY